MKSGPPLLPGLMAASVWTIHRPACWSNHELDTMPLVTVARPTPSGYPIVNTVLPSASSVPPLNGDALKPAEQQILRTARSLLASKPRTVAPYRIGVVD